MTTASHMPCLLNTPEASIFLGLPNDQLRRLVRGSLIPHIVLPDGEVRFDMDDLRVWLESRKVGCNEEQECQRT